jgi:hypothetical protein
VVRSSAASDVYKRQMRILLQAENRLGNAGMIDVTELLKQCSIGFLKTNAKARIIMP